MSYSLDISKYKKSSAGTNIESDDESLEVELKYTKTAWFFITFFGTTQTPYYVGFHCKRSNELFEEMTDKKQIKQYMLYRKK